jgi:hypothetical protein
MMPVAPAKTKTKFRPNGYLTDREAKIIVNRTLRDEPTKVRPTFPFNRPLGVAQGAKLTCREICTIASP